MLSTKPVTAVSRYTVMRPFFMDGRVCAVGDVVQLQGQFAVEMLAALKVAVLTDDLFAEEPQPRARVPRKTSRASEV